MRTIWKLRRQNRPLRLLDTRCLKARHGVRKFLLVAVEAGDGHHEEMDVVGMQAWEACLEAEGYGPMTAQGLVGLGRLRSLLGEAERKAVS